MQFIGVVKATYTGVRKCLVSLFLDITQKTYLDLCLKMITHREQKKSFL